MISDRTVRYLCWLTRSREVEPERAHAIRVQAHAGMIPAEADSVIAELTALPARDRHQAGGLRTRRERAHRVLFDPFGTRCARPCRPRQYHPCTMVDIDWSQIENVAPSQIKTGDILLVVTDLKVKDGYHKGVWGEVTDIKLLPKDSQCSIHKGTIHQFDAYHFTCEIYDERGSQLQDETLCYPMFFTGHMPDGKPAGKPMRGLVERSKLVD
jgi:hypothetical protein